MYSYALYYMTITVLNIGEIKINKKARKAYKSTYSMSPLKSLNTLKIYFFI